MNTIRISLVISILLLGCQDKIAPQIDLNAQKDTPALFAEGIVSTDLYERDMAISAAGDEIIYTLGNHKQTFRSLVGIKKVNGKWGKREILPFSGKYHDIEPFLSVDGQQLFFASTRPMDSDSARTDYNIWVAQRTAASWGEPVPLDTLINSIKDEFYPAVSSNGNLYFTATREDGIGREDIFISKKSDGKYLQPVALDSSINSAVYEFNAYISPEEDLLIFSSFGRADGTGGGDLYYSKKAANGEWETARNMGELVNSDKLDFCPYIDVHRKKFYFTSDRAGTEHEAVSSVTELIANSRLTLNGMGNIYMVNLESLKLNQ